VAALLTAAVATGGLAVSQARSTSIGAGTYKGSVRCTGSDRFSNGAPTRQYRSRPKALVVFASNRRLTRWTYLFIGRHNKVIQSRATRAGQSFTYAAGAHVTRPGRTRITILRVVSTARRVEVLARLDWSSPSTSYIGSGVYDLSLKSTGPRTISYDAVKVVIKLPEARPSAANPVIRRTEHCAGTLTR
jgi:hypothetical protein